MDSASPAGSFSLSLASDSESLLSDELDDVPELLELPESESSEPDDDSDDSDEDELDDELSIYVKTQITY